MKLTINFLFLMLVLAACGLDEKQKTYTNNDNSESQPYAPVTQKRQDPNSKLVEIPIKIEKAETGASLNLSAAASASSYKLSLTGCLSGYTQSNVTAGTIYVYQNDSGCKVALTEFTLDDDTYTLTHADASNFPGTLATGDSALFIHTGATAGAGNATDAEKMEVFITSTLTAAGVDVADTISFTFRQYVKGDDDLLDITTVQDGGHSAAVSGQNAPNFTIESVTLANLDGSGNGLWDFKLLCAKELSSVNTVCDDVLLTDVHYALILDTFGGSDPTRSDLQAAIDGGGDYVAGAAAAVIVGDVNNANVGVYHGGFDTLGASGTTYLSVSDTARTNIHTDTDMWLVLEANGSFKYFKITVTPVTN